MIGRQLSSSGGHAICREIIPGYVPGRHRYPTAYRGGDSPAGLAMDPEKLVFYDFPLGQGGDYIDFVMLARGCGFRDALAFILDVTGENLLRKTEKPARPTFSESALCKAELFKVGLTWRIAHALADAKAELFGNRHDEAAIAVCRLTQHDEAVKRWTAYDAAAAMTRASRQLTRECIAEAQKAYDELADLTRDLGGAT